MCCGICLVKLRYNGLNTQWHAQAVRHLAFVAGHMCFQCNTDQQKTILNIISNIRKSKPLLHLICIEVEVQLISKVCYFRFCLTAVVCILLFVRKFSVRTCK